MATHSSILARRIPMDRVAWRATVHGGRKESDMTEQLCTAQHIVKKNNLKQTSGFPCGSVVKNPRANTGEMGSIFGPRRSHMPQNNEAHAPQLLSLCSRVHMPQLLKPEL